MSTGVGCAILPTSSSVCIMRLMRGARGCVTFLPAGILPQQARGACRACAPPLQSRTWRRWGTLTLTAVRCPPWVRGGLRDEPVGDYSVWDSYRACIHIAGPGSLQNLPLQTFHCSSLVAWPKDWLSPAVARSRSAGHGQRQEAQACGTGAGAGECRGGAGPAQGCRGGRAPVRTHCVYPGPQPGGAGAASARARRGGCARRPPPRLRLSVPDTRCVAQSLLDIPCGVCCPALQQGVCIYVELTNQCLVCCVVQHACPVRSQPRVLHAQHARCGGRRCRGPGGGGAGRGV